MSTRIVHKQIILLIILLVFCSCNLSNKNSSELIIFHAGSLAVPFKEIAERFEEENPDINVVLEAAGSRKCARKIIDLKRECDIMASADYKVIDNLLIPEYADWNIKFAGNEMAIVYHEKSRLSSEINSDNWYNVLMEKNVVFGRSDPNFDPCGYRAVITIKLAEDYYNQPGLTKNLLKKDLNYIRPKEVDLIALLESDAIDYIFLYRSVAEQHGLKYLILPDSINLKDSGLANYYASATVDISGKIPGEIIIKKGEEMVYGVTIIKNAANKIAALKFLNFLLSDDKGMTILEKNGQESLVPTTTNSFDKIPKELKQFVIK
ncbi:tungstate ABC transporter substrate-binding protein WtpA [Bacteroidota bacterium]